MASMKHSHPRHIIRSFLPLDVCKELEFIHKSNCTVGYRPRVFSTTLSHLIATNCPHLIMPFIPIREKLKEKVEEVFGCEYELFVEFTGLISWTKGASIGWHSDDNRPYLRQRDFTDLVLYTADSRNIHCVDEITDGERLTLTLWFSRNSSHDEDAKLLSLLNQNISDYGHTPCIPLPASSNMYWFPSDPLSDHQQGFDLCFARLFLLGYDIYPSQENTCLPEMVLFGDVSDVFTNPVKLARGSKLFSKEFANLLHALQAVQFYNWKQSVLQESEVTRDTSNVVILSQAQKEEVSNLKQALLSHMQLDENVFCYGKGREVPFDWGCFSAAVTWWEEYMLELHKQLQMHLPLWKDHAFLFSVSSSVTEE